MTEIKILLDPTLALFYSRIADSLGQTLESVLVYALFMLAGELSLEALQEN